MFVGAILLIALAPSVQAITDPDFFWHLKVGQWIIDHGAIPHSDLFTFTVADHAFVAHEWLSEVIMAALTGAFGLTGPSLFFGVVTWLGFLALVRTPRASFLMAGLALALGMAAGMPIWGPRTQMITFALVAGLLLVLRRYRETGDVRWLYPLPPVFVIWVNLHAGFTVGLLFLFTYLLGELLYARFAADDAFRPRLRPLALVAVLCTAAVAINPNFVGIYAYAVQTQFSSEQQKLIIEWFSPNFHDNNVRPFELMLLLTVVVLIVTPRRPRVTDLLLVLGVIVLSLQSVRHIALFVAVVTPVLAEQVQAIVDGHRQRLPPFRLPRTTLAIGLLNLAVLLLVGTVISARFAIPGATAGFRNEMVTKGAPVAALDFVEADPPPGHVFNQYGWGGYFVYRLWPRVQPFVYGDAAVMGDPFLHEYDDVRSIRTNYRAVLDKYGVTWILYPTDDPLLLVMEQSPDWTVVHRDDVATILVRRTPETRDYLARHGQP
jgi:hypothetical protein